MKMRHKLINWLSFGDAVVLNVEILEDGRIRSMNAGRMLFGKLEIVRPADELALIVYRETPYRPPPPDATLKIQATGNQGAYIDHLEVRTIRRYGTIEEDGSDGDEA